MPPATPQCEDGPKGEGLWTSYPLTQAPEKLELIDGHVPGEEDLLLLLLKSVGLRRAAELVGPERWASVLREDDP